MKKEENNHENGEEQKQNKNLLPEKNVSFLEVGKVMVGPSEGEEENPKEVIRKSNESDETKKLLIAAIDRVDEMGKKTGGQPREDEPKNQLNKNMQTALNYRPANTKRKETNAKTQETPDSKETKEKESR